MSEVQQENKRKKLFLFVSLIILSLDLIFVGINYVSAKNALYHSLTYQSKNHQQSFTISTEMTYSSMLQIASFISKHKDYNQLFLKGKKAVAKEGGGKGGEKAAEARDELLKLIKPGWEEMTSAYGVRQLHYHLGPGSLSFLRVHKPKKFGDRMDKVRYTIVDTNATQEPQFGFETGRVYSGLRGVVPIFAIDPETQENVHVGAVEAGTSFSNILKVLDKKLDIGIAILLAEKHVKKNMWLEEVSQRFGGLKSACNCFLEQTSRKDAKHFLNEIKITPNFETNTIQRVTSNNRHYAVFYFPLYDYYAKKHLGTPPAGFVMIWNDVTDAIVEFNKNSLINIAFAALGFLIIEAVLLGALKIETRFRYVERMAILDGLTALPNRGNFDEHLEEEISRCLRVKKPLALIMCDIDFFKQFNDGYGHVHGDECLQAVAKSLQAGMKRGGDYVARYGGEEFVVILPSTELKGAVHIAEQLRHGIQNLQIAHKNSKVSDVVTMSFGIASFQCKTLTDSLNLIRVADHYLYVAKEKGRNRVESELSA